MSVNFGSSGASLEKEPQGVTPRGGQRSDDGLVPRTALVRESVNPKVSLMEAQL